MITVLLFSMRTSALAGLASYVTLSYFLRGSVGNASWKLKSPGKGWVTGYIVTPLWSNFPSWRSKGRGALRPALKAMARQVRRRATLWWDRRARPGSPAAKAFGVGDSCSRRCGSRAAKSWCGSGPARGPVRKRGQDSKGCSPLARVRAGVRPGAFELSAGPGLRKSWRGLSRLPPGGALAAGGRPECRAENGESRIRKKLKFLGTSSPLPLSSAKPSRSGQQRRRGEFLFGALFPRRDRDEAGTRSNPGLLSLHRLRGAVSCQGSSRGQAD